MPTWIVYDRENNLYLTGVDRNGRPVGWAGNKTAAKYFGDKEIQGVMIVLRGKLGLDVEEIVFTKEGWKKK